MTQLSNLRNGNPVTQRNWFLIIAIAIIIIAGALNHYGIINLPPLSKP